MIRQNILKMFAFGLFMLCLNAQAGHPPVEFGHPPVEFNHLIGL